MKLTISPADLKAALDVASKFAPAKPKYGIAILSMVLLDATPDGGLTISGTDSESRAWRTVGATVERPGRVALPPDRLVNVLEACGNVEQIVIDVDDTNRAQIVAGRTRCRCTGLPAEDFPPLPVVADPAFDLTLGAEFFASMIGSVIHAVAPDRSRPVSAGVSFEISPGRLTLAAADGFRLAVRSEEIETDAAFRCIVDGQPLSKILTTLTTADSVHLVVGPKLDRVHMESAAGCWALPLIDGQFHDWRRIVPKGATTVTTVAARDLLRALRLTRGIESSFNEGDKTITGVSVRLDIHGTTIEVRAGDTAGDTEAAAELDAEVAGSSLVIGFNGAYLRQAIEALGSDLVCLKTTEPIKPGIVTTPDDVRNENPQVLMPMKVGL